MRSSLSRVARSAARTFPQRRGFSASTDSLKQRLDRAIANKDILVAPGAYDGFSTKLIQLSDFQAVYLTGDVLMHAATPAHSRGFCRRGRVVQYSRTAGRGPSVHVGNGGQSETSHPPSRQNSSEHNTGVPARSAWLPVRHRACGSLPMATQVCSLRVVQQLHLLPAHRQWECHERHAYSAALRAGAWVGPPLHRLSHGHPWWHCPPSRSTPYVRRGRLPSRLRTRCVVTRIITHVCLRLQLCPRGAACPPLPLHLGPMQGVSQALRAPAGEDHRVCGRDGA